MITSLKKTRGAKLELGNAKDPYLHPPIVAPML